MTYAVHYARLVERARMRVLTGYSEQHHVVPRCLGGDDSDANTVRLTPEEHYVAHQLLVKMHPGHVGLTWAAVNMTGTTKKMARRNKLYGWLRRRWADRIRVQATGRVMSPESIAKMRAAKLGKKRAPHSAETRAKMSAASKGRLKSEVHRAALAAAHTGIKYQPRSEESKARTSIAVRAAFANGANHGDQSSPEYRAKQSMKSTEVWARRRAAKCEVERGSVQ